MKLSFEKVEKYLKKHFKKLIPEKDFCKFCKKQIKENKCRAYCCNVFLMDKEIFERNKHKARKFIKIEIIQHKDVDYMIPLTPDLKCCFLTPELTCSIYNDRPSICRSFGNSNIAVFACPNIVGIENNCEKKDAEMIINFIQDLGIESEIINELKERGEIK